MTEPSSNAQGASTPAETSGSILPVVSPAPAETPATTAEVPADSDAAEDAAEAATVPAHIESAPEVTAPAEGKAAADAAPQGAATVAATGADHTHIDQPHPNSVIVSNPGETLQDVANRAVSEGKTLIADLQQWIAANPQVTQGQDPHGPLAGGDRLNVVAHTA